MQRRQTLQLILAALVIAAMTAACSDPDIPQPEVLEAPVSMSEADGEVCLPTVLSEDATIPVGPLPRCEDDGQGFALVANQRSAQVGVLALGQDPSRFVNLDARRPGVTQISVADRPVDITTTGDGTAALVASETTSVLTGIDLWTLRPLAQQIDIDGTPRAIESIQNGDGDWLTLTLTQSPNRIDIRGGLRCERPGEGIDRRDRRPDQNCQWIDAEVQSIELPARPVDMAVDPLESGLWVIYRDRNELSWIVFDEEDLDEDEQCLDEEAIPPCEVDRIGWDLVDEVDVNGEGDEEQEEEESVRWGATEVDVDPVGLFTYVLDRPNHQLFVFDNRRRQLIHASDALEPPVPPSQTRAGIPTIRSSLAMGAELQREVLVDGDPAHIVYRAGVQVAANTGQLYRAASVDFECLVEGGDILSNEVFLHDAQRRAQSEEVHCLQLPEFPLGGDPDFDTDEELQEMRFFEPSESATLAVSPIFGLRDGIEQEGRLAPSSTCVQPEQLVDAVDDIADADAVQGCGSPLVPQPLGLDVDDELDDFSEQPRAELMEFARAVFNEQGEAQIWRSTYDQRLRNEEWTVSYEGALPDPGRSADGLVSREQPGIFLSGGLDYCAAGVEAGDRITILSEPADRSECEVFRDVEEDPQFRTYDVVEVGAFELQLEVIDDEDRVAELPTRECFDRGLSYEVRPVDQWTVFGDDSGLLSPWERDDGACVLSEDADAGWRQSRVETGEQFLGPYLQFRIREGEVEPVQGLEYSFEVLRNFSVFSEGIIPEGGSSLPAQVRLTPDLGDGRYLVVVDAGGDRLFLRNLSQLDRNPSFLR